MRVSLSILGAVVVAFFAGAVQAVNVTTTVDEDARIVRLEFTDLPPYEQIRLEGVTALYWCNCSTNDNPRSLRSTGFTVNGVNLEMQYEDQEPPPPATNFIEYHYLDGYVFDDFESVEWIMITEAGGGETTLTGNRPVFVPEPSAAMLHFVALATVCGVRRSLRSASPSRSSI